MNPCAICLEEINPEDKLAININVARKYINKFHDKCMLELPKKCPGGEKTCPVCRVYLINYTY